MNKFALVLVLCSLILFGCSAKASPELIAKGKKLVPTVCTRCHPVSEVQGHRDTRAGWSAVMERMKGYGAQISAEEQDAITAYLADAQPKK